MSEWVVDKVKNQVSLLTDYVANGSFASLAENVTYHNSEDYAYLIRLTDYNNGFEGDFVYVDQHSYNFLAKSKLFGGEIIISNVGAYAGTTFLAPKLDKPMTLGPNAVMLNFQSGNKFYYYWFRSPLGKHALDGIISGSAQPKFNKTSFKEIEIPVPPLHEQKAIASVLSSLDDKIDLLHRQNKTLEAMAETLFRQWFIEEAKEDWEESDLTQLIQLQSGYAFKSKDFQEQGNFGVIKIKNISGSIVDIQQTDFVEDSVGLATAQRFYVKSGQVLIAMTGAEIGKLGLVPKTNKQLLLNQRVGLLVPKFKGAEYLAYLHLHSEFGQDYIENSATGSAQPNISGSLIEACPFPKCEDSFLKQCGEQVYIYYEKVKENLGQIQTLEKLRDTLLPKLMSGEVRVQVKQESAA